jgi:hypothetical protein
MGAQAMSALLTWIQSNPAAFKGFLTAFLALLVKLILQLSGKSDQLAHWNDAASQLIDLVVYAVSAYGVVCGGLHASRGPALTPTESASVIVAALAPAPVALAVEQVKTIVEEVAVVKTAPAVSEMPGSHRF